MNQLKYERIVTSNQVEVGGGNIQQQLRIEVVHKEADYRQPHGENRVERNATGASEWVSGNSGDEEGLTPACNAEWMGVGADYTFCLVQKKRHIWEIMLFVRVREMVITRRTGLFK
jgi:hypothetical protein